VTIKVAYYPAFDAAAALTDRFWRAVHYLGPVADRIGSIVMAGDAGAIGPPPSCFDQTLSERAKPIANRLERPAAVSLDDADIVIVWDKRHARDTALRGVKHVVTLDPETLHEGDLSIELGAGLAAKRETAREQSRRRLQQALGVDAQPIAHLFGSGPSLATLDMASIAPGVAMVCNSVVRDEALMARLKPRFMTAIDPIFHAGPSRYAGVFREQLVRFLEAHRPWFVIQERDAHLYEALLPQALHDLIIAIPVRYALRANLDVSNEFWLTATRNVLTLTMLPLAAALAKEVRIYGCDGRSTSAQEGFWSYAPAANFDEELTLQRSAHPGFFTLDYQDYYALHCETVRQWIRSIERGGVGVGAATPSFIPALAARAMPGVPRGERASLSFELAGRAAYLRRGAQSMYGAVLASNTAPAWLKQGLRAAVRASREIGV
jgi:hypothetical protein